MKSLVWKNGLDASVPFVVGFVAEGIEVIPPVMMDRKCQEVWKRVLDGRFVSGTFQNRGRKELY
jgi:hypothetical protein